MEIYWITTQLKTELEDEAFLTKRYDQKVARKVAQRLREIGAAPSYAKLPPATGKHPIKEGSRFLYFAVDVPGLGEKRGKLRLLFKPFGEYNSAHVETIVAVVILGLDDYH